MESQAIHVMTITNSIIGVSLLAMPYCFKQCGIVLSICMLIVSNAIARLCCHLMLKSAVIARRRTFEFLAFHTFGSLGKFSVEIGLIGFLVGTCIAYFVVMGDLGPAIVAKMSNTRVTDTLRTSIMLALALFCVLPLGLLRNIDSLSSVCTITVGFYFCLVLKIISEAVPHIILGDWISKVELWKPSGILQCLPIFSMALSCQTQIFEIYQALPAVSLERMNHLIGAAVNICTAVYICVGVFGYVAFATQTFTGNILMTFSPSFITDLMKIGFVLSLAFSFPLIIFPCRASLNSLLCRRHSYTLHDGVDKYIPESRFKGLTFFIVLISLIVGLSIPNIELVLGLLGSTIGVMICVLFPATCFICISTKNTNERILAQIMLFIGVLTMVLGTYANLYAMEEITTTQAPDLHLQVPKIVKQLEKIAELKINENVAHPDVKLDTIVVVRHEPPQPIEPVNEKIDNVAKVEIQKESIIDNIKPVEEIKDKLSLQTVPPIIQKPPDLNSKKAEEVDIEAIKKEDVEMLEEENKELKEYKQKNMDFIKKIEEQNVVHLKVAEESKKLLEEIKQRQIAQEKVKMKIAVTEAPNLDESKNKELKDVEEINMNLIKTIEKQNKEIKKVAEESKQLLEKENEKKIAVTVNENDSKREVTKTKPFILQKMENSISNMLPLPLQKSNFTGDGKLKDIVKVANPGIKTTVKPMIAKPSVNSVVENRVKANVLLDELVNTIVLKNKTANATNDEKLLHREIRSTNEKSTIEINEPLKKTADKDNLLSNNNNIIYEESLVLKTISKSSETLLDTVKLPNVRDKEIEIPLQPLKRDLKNYKIKRK
ncbi:hypothetical protein FQA39_LY17897 [Lamprigera yunnana]|nr:hypothetical protein FQA39_LY17897 [Lamprigera yunnana]